MNPDTTPDTTPVAPDTTPVAPDTTPVAPAFVPTRPPGMAPPPDSSACVLLSGGQDSTTCLLWSLVHFERVVAVGFDYGQRHAVELEQARRIADMCGVPYHVIPMRGAFTGSTLTDLDGSTDTPHAVRPDLPSSFTAGRNIAFLALAAGYAFGLGIHDLVTGVCQTDESGYPDCRAPFVDAMTDALALGLDVPSRIHAPLLTLTKAETWRLAHQLGGLDLVVEHTHTDYHGDRTVRHPWGYGNLDNPASRLRAAGFDEAVAAGYIPAPTP